MLSFATNKPAFSDKWHCGYWCDFSKKEHEWGCSSTEVTDRPHMWFLVSSARIGFYFFNLYFLFFSATFRAVMASAMATAAKQVNNIFYAAPSHLLFLYFSSLSAHNRQIKFPSLARKQTIPRSEPRGSQKSYTSLKPIYQLMPSAESIRR